MMNEKTKYETYRKMFDRTRKLEIKIKEHLSHVYPKIYGVFVSVGDEEKGLYFVDIEVADEKYERVRGMFTEEQILKKFC